MCSLAFAADQSLLVLFNAYENAHLSINTFYGIRFAAPPTGSLRWKAPVPIESKNNYTGALLNASSPGPQCWQGTLETELEYAALFSSIDGMAYALGLGSAEGVARINSEDCLLLDVIVPSQPKSSLLPVIIQIHGGGPLSTTFHSGHAWLYLYYAYRLCCREHTSDRR